MGPAARKGVLGHTPSWGSTVNEEPSSRDPLADEPRPDAYVYDPGADAARAAMAVTPEDFGEPVPIEVEAVEGWDPSPPLPPDWEPTWYDTEDLMAVLEPELVAAARASRTEALEVPALEEAHETDSGEQQ